MTTSGGLSTFEPQQVHSFAKQWEALFDAADAAGLAASYAEDALLVATEAATVRGRAAIEAFWRQSCERARSLGLIRTVHPEHTEHDGALGYSRGEVRMQSAALGARTVHYVTVWKRHQDGLWRCVVDISTPTPDRGRQEAP